MSCRRWHHRALRCVMASHAKGCATVKLPNCESCATVSTAATHWSAEGKILLFFKIEYSVKSYMLCKWSIFTFSETRNKDNPYIWLVNGPLPKWLIPENRSCKRKLFISGWTRSSAFVLFLKNLNPVHPVKPRSTDCCCNLNLCRVNISYPKLPSQSGFRKACPVTQQGLFIPRETVNLSPFRVIQLDSENRILKIFTIVVLCKWRSRYNLQ